jgi:hypothetical protein
MRWRLTNLTLLDVNQRVNHALEHHDEEEEEGNNNTNVRGHHDNQH